MKIEIFYRVKKCFVSAFNVKDKVITAESSMDNTRGWDSLGHLKLIMELENEFNISFLTVDIPKLKTVDIICLEVERYLS